jgi:CubicO group peptidase (beta-lactamase class C family)
MQDHPAVTLETTMQSILGLRTPDNKPPVDARFNDITIRHLIESTSGLDNNFVFRSLEATAAAKAGLPATPSQLERYGASLALNGKPGDPKHVVYSNAGYFMAGRVLAKLRGTTDYVQALQPLLKPLQMKRVRLSRTLLALQAPDEARYHDYGLSVAKSIRSDQRPIVPIQYGAWDCDLAEGAGGLSVAITDIARMAAMLSQPQGNPVFTPATYSALFENAANATATLTGPEAHGYHGFDGVRRLPQGAGYRGNKGGYFTGSQSAIDVTTNGLSFAIAVNGNEHEGVGNAWSSLTQPFAKKHDWPKGDLFPQFGMAALAAI